MRAPAVPMNEALSSEAEVVLQSIIDGSMETGVSSNRIQIAVESYSDQTEVRDQALHRYPDISTTGILRPVYNSPTHHLTAMLIQ